MVRSRSEAVRPRFSVTAKEETNRNGLSHLGETEMDVESESKMQSASSTDKTATQDTREEQGGQEGKDEDEEEEAQEPVTRKAPKGPTKEERERHEATHLPFREWCPHCVRGRARNRPHKKAKEDDEKETKVVRVSMDYFFMRQDEEKVVRIL